MGANSGCLWVVFWMLSIPFDPGGCVVRGMYLVYVTGRCRGVLLLQLRSVVVHHCVKAWRLDRRILNCCFVRISIGFGYLSYIHSSGYNFCSISTIFWKFLIDSRGGLLEASLLLDWQNMWMLCRIFGVNFFDQACKLRCCRRFASQHQGF